MKIRLILLLSSFPLIMPAIAFAQSKAAKSPQWYEVAAGVLAIPATLIGLAYSFVLIRKTSIESRKLKLEIREKEREFSEDNIETSEEHARAVGAAIRDSLVASILLRFALMYVVLALWGMISNVFGTIVSGAIISLEAFKLLDFTSSGFGYFFWMISQIPQIVGWIIVLALGIPLLREISGYLGVSGLGIFSRKRN